MATGADLLASMSDLNDEIETAAGQADYTRALRALNRAQDLLELEIAQIPMLFGTTSDLTTTASTRTTTNTTSFIRYDRVHYVDSSTSRHSEIDRVPFAGDLMVTGDPLMSASASTTGIPQDYSLYGSTFYWDPIPAGAYTIRIYGFAPASDITNASTFAYGDEMIWPISAVASRMFKQRLDDPQQEIQAFAGETFARVLQQYKNRHNDGPLYPRYGSAHTI